MQYSDLFKVLNRGINHFPGSGYAPVDAAQHAVALLCCQGPCPACSPASQYPVCIIARLNSFLKFFLAFALLEFHMAQPLPD